MDQAGTWDRGDGPPQLRGTTTDELRAILNGIQAAGIENVLALRGDPPRGETEWKPHPGGLHYSTELAALIREGYPFSVGAACFPEVHPEAPDLAHDLRFSSRRSTTAPRS